jgi:hypothetical protein
VNHKYPKQPAHVEDFVFKKPTTSIAAVSTEVEKHEIIPNVVIPNPVLIETTTKSDIEELNFSSTTKRLFETSSSEQSHHHYQENFETTTKTQSIDPRIMNLDSNERNVEQINEINEQRSDENIIF